MAGPSRAWTSTRAPRARGQGQVQPAAPDAPGRPPGRRRDRVRPGPDATGDKPRPASRSSTAWQSAAGEQPHIPGIEAVQGHAHGHGLAVAQRAPGCLLQGNGRSNGRNPGAGPNPARRDRRRRPCVPCAAARQRSTATATAAASRAARRGASATRRRKKSRSRTRATLDRLGQAGPDLAAGRLASRSRFVHTPRTRRERAQVVLAAKGVDAVFEPHSGIVLGQHRGRQPHQAHAPVGRAAPQARGIQDRPAADGHDKGLAAQPAPEGQVPDGLDHGEVRLGRLAAGNDQGFCDQAQPVAVGGQIGVHSAEQPGIGRGQTASTTRPRRCGPGTGPVEHAGEHVVGRIEDVSGKMHGKGEGIRRRVARSWWSWNLVRLKYRARPRHSRFGRLLPVVAGPGQDARPPAPPATTGCSRRHPPSVSGRPAKTPFGGRPLPRHSPPTPSKRAVDR